MIVPYFLFILLINIYIHTYTCIISIYLSIYLCIYLSTYLSIYLSIYSNIYKYFSLYKNIIRCFTFKTRRIFICLKKHLYWMMPYPILSLYPSKVVKSFQLLYDGVALEASSSSSSSPQLLKMVVTELRGDWKYLVEACI